MGNKDQKQIQQSNPAKSIRSFNKLQWWIFFVLLFLIVLLSGCYSMVNGDIWWHLKTGQLILTEGHIPRTNRFTYTNPESLWIDLHWLFQIIVAIIYNWSGTSGLILFKSIVGAGVFALLMLTGYRRLPVILMACCWLPFIWIYIDRFHVRPEIMSHLLLALTILCIHKHKTGCKRWIWALVPLQIVWVNSQGLFVLQLCVLGAYCVNEQIKGFTSYKINGIWYVLLACSIATVLNPYGLQGALFPLELLDKVGGDQRQFFQLLAGETKGMGEFISDYGLDGILHSSTPRLILITAPVCITAVIWGALNRQQNTIFHCLLLIGFGYLVWNMNRNASLYSIVWGYVLTCVLGDWLLNARDSHIPGIAIRSVSGVLIAFLALNVVVKGIDIIEGNELEGNHYPSRRAGFGESQWYNHQAATFIAELPGISNLYVHYNGTGFAGVIIFNGFGDEHKYPKRVFADARLETNKISVLKDFMSVIGEGNQNLQNAEKILEKYSDGPTALVFKNSDLIYRPRLLEDLISSPQWRSVYISTEPNIAEGVSVFVPDSIVQCHSLEIVSLSLLRAYR